jgi:hypothetical protein
MGVSMGPAAHTYICARVVDLRLFNRLMSRFKPSPMLLYDLHCLTTLFCELSSPMHFRIASQNFFTYAFIE